MPLKAPSFFDDLERMRTPSRRFDPTMNFRPVLRELAASCRAHRYLGISPQNLTEPAPLVRAVVMKEGQEYTEFVDPKIVMQSGSRFSNEGCANIYLMYNGQQFSTGALVERPTRITVEYRTSAGALRRRTFQDTTPVRSKAASIVGIFCHELEHNEGRLIVDAARELLLAGMLAVSNAETLDEKNAHAADFPAIILRDGDGYVLRHGAEFLDLSPPEVSPDALFVPADLCWRIRNIRRFKVPRAGELLPIRFSGFVKDRRNPKKKKST